MHFNHRSMWWGILALVLSFHVTSWAQGQGTPLEIRIGPPGSTVELKGPQHTLTASPNSIDRPMAGWYHLKASYRGFESFSRDVYIDPQSPASITGTLTPKSRLKAGVRSVFLPGWGHYYSDRVPRGVAFSLLTVGMAVGYYFFDAHADNRLEDYETLRNAYDDAQSVEEQQALEPFVNKALKDAYNADRNRITWGYMTLGVYLYQIIDAVLFFPSVPEAKKGPMQVGLTMPNANAVGVRASYDF